VTGLLYLRSSRGHSFLDYLALHISIRDEGLEDFHWESFEIWLDTNSDQRAQCHQQETGTNVAVSHEGVSSSDSFIFPLSFI